MYLVEKIKTKNKYVFKIIFNFIYLFSKQDMSL
jgi:hypothetical protein